MAEKVTISLEVDVSDLEELSKEGKEAGDEMESAFSKISKQAKNLFDQGAFDKISGQLLDLNEGFNNLLRQSIEPLTRQMGVFGGVLDFALERFIDFKDALVTGPIKAFSGSIAFATGTIKSLAQAVPVVGDSIKGLINQIPKLTSVFLALSTTVQGAIAGQLAVLPGILGAIGIAATGLATTLGRSLEDSFNRVAEIVAGTTVRMKELEQQLIEIGSTVPENLDQVAKTMRTITKAGIRSEKTIDDLTRTTVKLGRLADASFTQVGEQITNIATSFDLLGKNAGENVDAFANDIITVRNNTVAGVSEITTSLRRVASSASVLDIPIDQMLALTGAIQQAGQTARRSGTRLRRGFEEIVQTLSDVEGQRAFADLLNIDTSEFRSRIQSDVGSVIIDLANALGNSEENAKDFANTIDTLGTAGGTALTAVASKAGLLNELLGKMEGNTNALQKATETTLDRFSQQFSILTDKITLFFKTIGLAVLDPFTNLVRNINKQLDQARSRVMAFARTIRENIPDIKNQISELFGFEGEGFTGFNLDSLKDQVNTTFKEVGNLFGDTIVTVLKAGFKNVILPLAWTFGKNTIAIFRAFFTTDFGMLVWNNLKWAFNKLVSFLFENVLPLFGRMASHLVDQVVSGLSSLTFSIFGKNIGGINIASENLNTFDEKLVMANDKIEKVSDLFPVLDNNLEGVQKSLNKVSNSWNLLSDQQKNTAIDFRNNLIGTLDILQDKAKKGILEPKIYQAQLNALQEDLNSVLSPTNIKNNIKESKNAINKMSQTVSDNFVDTLFKLVDEGIFTKEQKQRIKNNSKEMARLIFGDEAVNEAKKAISGDLSISEIIKQGLSFKEAVDIKFPDELGILDSVKRVGKEIRQSRQIAQANKRFIDNLAPLNNIPEEGLNALNTLKIDQAMRSIEQQDRISSFQNANIEQRQKLLDKQWKLAQSQADLALFGLKSADEALKDIRNKDRKTLPETILNFIEGENLSGGAKKRAEKIGKNLGDSITNSWAKGIEAIIQGEEFNVVQSIANSFVTQFSQQLARKMSDAFGAQSVADKLANVIVGGIEKIFQKTSEKAQGEGQSIGGSIVGGIGELLGFRKGGQIPQMANGGQMKGQGGIDQIMAMLSRGEFVVRREAVNAQTLPFLQQLNQNKGFRQGGQVGSSSGQSDGLPNSGNKYEININAVDASSFQALVENNPEVITRQIEKNIEKNGSVRKMIQQKASK